VRRVYRRLLQAERARLLRAPGGRRAAEVLAIRDRRPHRAGRRDIIEKVLPYRDGRCIFLGDDDRCTIYEDRPANCRRFECTRAYHLGGRDVTRHGIFLQRNPAVRYLLDQL
jgi:Fe-S-cluster containining protein